MMKNLFMSTLLFASQFAHAQTSDIPCDIFLQLEVSADQGTGMIYGGAPTLSDKQLNALYSILESRGYKLAPEELGGGILADRLMISTTTFLRGPKHTVTTVTLRNEQNQPGSLVFRDVYRNELLGSVTTHEYFGKLGSQGPSKKISDEMIRALPEALPYCTSTELNDHSTHNK